MAEVPETSTTLLRVLGADSAHERWADFVTRYEPLMRAFLQARFPALEADDLVQETLVALVAVLPDYHYQPEETGRFRNFLIGILRHKALKACSRERRLDEVRSAVSGGSPEAARGVAVDDEVAATEERAFKQAVADIALAEFFADRETAPRTQEVFRRVAMMGEAPECVARSFAMSRHAVDQIKARTLARLRRRV
ncbi:MAG: sigma-70 family RNA polymerase sigma factor, partial [Kiritimatiellia bacterium]